MKKCLRSKRCAGGVSVMEAVLLAIVALVILAGIYAFVKRQAKTMGDKEDAADSAQQGVQFK